MKDETKLLVTDPVKSRNSQANCILSLKHWIAHKLNSIRERGKMPLETVEEESYAIIYIEVNQKMSGRKLIILNTINRGGNKSFLCFLKTEGNLI